MHQDLQRLSDHFIADLRRCFDLVADDIAVLFCHLILWYSFRTRDLCDYPFKSNLR